MNYADRYRNIVDELTGQGSSISPNRKHEHSFSSSSSSGFKRTSNPISPGRKSCTISSLKTDLCNKELQLVELRAQRWELADSLRLARAELTQTFALRHKEARIKDADIQKLEEIIAKQKGIISELQRELDCSSTQRNHASTLEQHLQSLNQELLETQDRHSRDVAQFTTQNQALLCKVEEQEQHLADFRTALQQKFDVEMQLKELLRARDNEVSLRSADAERQRQLSQQQVNAAVAEAQQLRSALMSEQKSSQELRLQLETAASELQRESSSHRDSERTAAALQLQLRHQQGAEELRRERDALQTRAERLQANVHTLTVELEMKSAEAVSASGAGSESEEMCRDLRLRLEDMETTLGSKDVLLAQLDEQMCEAERQNLELQKRNCKQDRLIKDLYNRLEIVPGEASLDATAANISEAFKAEEDEVPAGFESICASICDDSMALANLIRSQLDGHEPDMRYLVGERKSTDPTRSSRIELQAAATELNRLRSTVADEYANRIGDSCAMQ